MSLLVRLATRIYRLMLACYPAGFRAEFGAEMQMVFSTVMREVQRSGKDKFWKLVWREFRGWPGSVLQAHLQARRNKMAVQDQFTPTRPAELLAALTIFLIPTIATLLVMIVGAGNMNKLPKWLDIILVIFFLGSLTAAFGFAIIRGLPRWSLSYLGFFLMLGIILARYDRIWSWIYPHFIQSFGPRSNWQLAVRISYVGVFEFIMLFSILLSALILVNLLRLLPYSRGVWQRIRADWTQFSFVFYGGLVFGILLAFDEYHYDQIWKFLAWICLALGAWFYLRVRKQKQRILALMGGATGAMWIVALAKWVLIPFQKWPDGYPVAPSQATRWVETSSAMIGWGWILIMLLAPALLNLLPTSPPQNVQEEIGSA